MHLQPASTEILPGLPELLADLGEGEHGFSGTPVARGEMSLPDYLLRCVQQTRPAGLPPGLVPQTVFWLLDEQEEAVGMIRVRHYLNDKLRERGGHIGYYIRRDQRGKGYGRAALRLALIELARLGEPRAMLSVDMDNPASIRVIEANGGQLENTALGEDGRPFGRYWIELGGQHPS